MTRRELIETLEKAADAAQASADGARGEEERAVEVVTRLRARAEHFESLANTIYAEVAHLKEME